LDRELGWPQNQSEHGEEKRSQKLNPGYPACSLVTMLTELPWLSVERLSFAFSIQVHDSTAQLLREHEQEN